MGFAARCKDWLCLSVELALRLGYAPSHFSPCPAYGYRESQRLILYNRAQPKGKRASLTERHSHSSQRAAKPCRAKMDLVAAYARHVFKDAAVAEIHRDDLFDHRPARFGFTPPISIIY